MQQQRLKKIIIVLCVGILLFGICLRLFVFTQPIIITKSYIEIYPYTEVDGESISEEWQYVKNNTNEYQIMYKGEKLPSEKMEDYIYVHYYFNLQRNSISGSSDIELVCEKFNKHKEAFIYSFRAPFPMRLNQGKMKTMCSCSVVMYVGGLSKKEIDESVRNTELSLLYMIDNKSEKMKCMIDENTPIFYRTDEEE